MGRAASKVLESLRALVLKMALVPVRLYQRFISPLSGRRWCGGLMFFFASILQPLEDGAEKILLFLHNQGGFGWGMSIVGMTVIVRLAIVPLTIKQIRSMNALRELQPQVKL